MVPFTLFGAMQYPGTVPENSLEQPGTVSPVSQTGAQQLGSPDFV